MKFDYWFIHFERIDWSIIPLQIDYFQTGCKESGYKNNLGITILNFTMDFEWENYK